jgi:protein-tyrosine phosphatase
MTSLLLLCTGNLCRSVMGQAMLSARLAARGTPGTVRSAGLLSSGQRPPAEVIAVMAARGFDVSGHRSREVTLADLAADLVIGMAREHVRYAAVRSPQCWPRAFTLRELVRRGTRAGPRLPGEPLSAWLARAGAGRDRRDLLGTAPADDVPDPYGGPASAYAATATLLDALTRDLAALCWPALGRFHQGEPLQQPA